MKKKPFGKNIKLAILIMVMIICNEISIAQTYRLTDVETYEEGNSRKYLGIWREGNDAYYLWAGVDWQNFSAKCSELENQNLRLVDVERYMDGNTGRYIGVWREGNDPFAFHVGLNWDQLVEKWQTLAQQHLRLTNIESYIEGGTRKYIGIWREGDDPYYLWAGDWNSFSAKCSELQNQNLRLVSVETHMDGNTRKFIGVWRSGNYAFQFFVGMTWNDLVAKMQQFDAMGLRLEKLETYEEGGVRKYIGIWKEGHDGYFWYAGMSWGDLISTWNNLAKGCTNGINITPCANPNCMPQVMANKGYSVDIPATDIHCEGIHGSCPVPGTTDKVNYKWPIIEHDDIKCIRQSAIDINDQIFQLPFNEPSVTMGRIGWLYVPGNWHHAMDYFKIGGTSFPVLAAADGTVIFKGWDNWSGNTVVISHDVGDRKDVYRTIYMHLRNGPDNDCNNSWINSMPGRSGSERDNYKEYLEAHGCKENPNDRNLDIYYWGTASQSLDNNLVGRHVNAGDFIGWSGDTGPGGCGCINEGQRQLTQFRPNNHLHIFFAHRDPIDNQWYFFDPYGIYGTPECYPIAVDMPDNSSCTQFKSAWKNGSPSFPNGNNDFITSIKLKITTSNQRNSGTDDIIGVWIGGYWFPNLDNPLQNDFERGQTNEFILPPILGMRMSNIHSLKIIKSPDGRNGAWRPSNVELILNGQSVLNARIDRWLSNWDGLTWVTGF